jgi:DNA-binding winged helix-turn-helix (wHTH) protein
MLCDRCQDEIERGVALPEWARGAVWLVAGERRQAGPTARRIFRLLWSRRGRLVSREGLMTVLWGLRADPPQDATLTAHILRLRQLLDGSGWGVVNAYGAGWQLVPAAEALARQRPRPAAGERAAGRLRARGLAMALETHRPSERPDG